MSRFNIRTETDSPDQQTECVFDNNDLDVSDAVRENYNLEEWKCSRPVWEKASEKRCVWHASDGQTQEKPHAELEKTVGDGDLHGSTATGVNLSGIDFPVETGFIDADLSDADLEDADLSGATLDNIALSGATLNNVDISETTLDVRYAMHDKILNKLRGGYHSFKRALTLKRGLSAYYDTIKIIASAAVAATFALAIRSSSSLNPREGIIPVAAMILALVCSYEAKRLDDSENVSWISVIFVFLGAIAIAVGGFVASVN
jgi:uncharacterized protein YjbI with pentapeptide repeats